MKKLILLIALSVTINTFGAARPEGVDGTFTLKSEKSSAISFFYNDFVCNQTLGVKQTRSLILMASGDQVLHVQLTVNNPGKPSVNFFPKGHIALGILSTATQLTKGKISTTQFWQTCESVYGVPPAEYAAVTKNCVIGEPVYGELE